MYESNMQLLGMCYDSIEEIRDGYYVAALNGKKQIIDAGNNVIVDNIKGKVVCGIGNKLYIEQDYAYYEYDARTFERIRLSEYEGFERISPYAWRVKSNRRAYNAYGLINSEGIEVLPCIYKYIYIYSSRSTHDYLKVMLHRYFEDSIYENHHIDKDEVSYLIVDKQYRKTDCLMAIETGIPCLQLVITDVKISDCRWQSKQAIRYNGKIVGNEYDGIMVRKGLDRLGLLQTYKKVDGKNTTGYVRFDGTEVVPIGKYKLISYIGNGITIVENDDGFGTYINNQEVVKAGTLSNYYITNNIPVAMGIVNEHHKFIGNDGRLHDKISDAFPIYQSKINQSIYLICLYGTWLYVDSNLNRIDDSILTKDIKTKEQWIKV